MYIKRFENKKNSYLYSCETFFSLYDISWVIFYFQILSVVSEATVVGVKGGFDSLIGKQCTMYMIKGCLSRNISKITSRGLDQTIQHLRKCIYNIILASPAPNFSFQYWTVMQTIIFNAILLESINIFWVGMKRITD